MAKVKNSEKELVRKIYKSVQKQKADLELAGKGKYETDGIFQMSRGEVINLKTERNVLRLRDGLAFLLEKKQFIVEANKIAGIEDAFTYQGVTEAEWISDFKVSITKLDIQRRKAKLVKDEENLQRMDPSLLKDIALEELSKLYLAEEEVAAVTLEEVISK